MSTAEFWKGDFGESYTARNRVDWRRRIPFWRDVMELTGARSVFEFGCNSGWNLSAIKRSYHDVQTYGVDVNDVALQQAELAGHSVDRAGDGPVLEHEHNAFDLTFTAGVLIHIAPEDILETMTDIANLSAQYVLAVEYAADKEEEVEYRGHSGKLWRRPFGRMYQDLGIKQVASWPAGDGFDNCTAWLMSK